MEQCLVSAEGLTWNVSVSPQPIFLLAVKWRILLNQWGLSLLIVNQIVSTMFQMFGVTGSDYIIKEKAISPDITLSVGVRIIWKLLPLCQLSAETIYWISFKTLNESESSPSSKYKHKAQFFKKNELTLSMQLLKLPCNTNSSECWGNEDWRNSSLWPPRITACCVHHWVSSNGESNLTVQWLK